MAIPGYTLIEIQDTDTFKQWADKCKDIQTALNNTQFITSTSGVTVDTAQSITGVKTFDAPLLASDSVTVNSPNKSFTISGNGSFNVSKNVFFTSDFNSSGETTLTATSSDPLRLKNGVQSSLLVVDSSGNLDVSSELSAQKLISDTGLSVTSNADIGGNVDIVGNTDIGGNVDIVGTLEIGSSQTTINSLTYTWPNSAPNGVSYLKNDNGVFEWEDEASHNAAAVTAAISQLGETNFTLPVEVVPITTITEADITILDEFVDNGDGTYGASTTLLTWRVCDGSTVSFDLTSSPPDDRYKDICLALNTNLVPSDTSGSATLPNLSGQAGSTIKIIKAESDQTVSFAVNGGDGISITAVGPNSSNLANSFDIYGSSSLKLDVNAFDFNFVNRELQIDATDFGNLDDPSGASQKTVVRRDELGCTYMNDPVSDRHVTNKRWVENEIQELKDEKDVDIQQLSDSFEEELNIQRGSVRAFHGDIYKGRKNNQSHALWPSGKHYNFIDSNGNFLFLGEQAWSSFWYRPFGGPKSTQIFHPTSLPFKGVNYESQEGYSSNIKEVIPLLEMTLLIDEDNYMYALGYDRWGYAYTDPNIAVSSKTRQAPLVCRKRDDNLFQVDWVSARGSVYSGNGASYITLYYKETDSVSNYGDVYVSGYNSAGGLGDGTNTTSAFGQKPRVMGLGNTAKTMFRYFAEAGGSWDPDTDSVSSDDGTDDFRDYFHNSKSSTDEYHIHQVKTSNGGASAIIRSNDPSATNSLSSNNRLWTTGGGHNGNGTRSGEDTRNWLPVVKWSDQHQITISSWNNGVYTASSPHGLETLDIVFCHNTTFIARLGDFDGNNKDVKFRLYNADNSGITKAMSNADSGVYKNSNFQSTLFQRLKSLRKIKKVENIGWDINDQNGIALDYDGVVWGWGHWKNSAGTGNDDGSETKYARKAVSINGFVNSGIEDIWGSDSGVSYCTKIEDVGGGSTRTDIYSCGSADKGTLGHGSLSSQEQYFKKLSYITEDINHSVHKVFLTGSYTAADSRVGTGVYIVTQPVDGVGKAKLWVGGHNTYSSLGTGEYHNQYTPTFLDVTPPEDPLKLREVSKNSNTTILLFKDDENDLAGRVYASGYGGTYNIYQTIASNNPYRFTPVDRNLSV